MEKKYLQLIEYLQLIPTGDNAQQFHFVILDNTLNIIHDHAVAKHQFNQNNIASFISLGMMIEVAENFASLNHLSLDMKIAENLRAEDIWLELKLTPSEHYSISSHFISIYYLDNLKKRMTYRAPFKGRKIDIDALKSKFKTEVFIKEKLSFSYFKTIFKTESIVFKNRNVFNNIAKWIRFSQHDLLKTKTGMSLNNLFIDPVSGFFIRIAFKHPKIGNFIRKVFESLNVFKIFFHYPLNAKFILIPIKGSNDIDIVNAGKAILSSWLTLTENGLVAQPISSVSMLSFSVEKNMASFDSSSNRVFKEAYLATINEFQLSQCEGFWLMRFGYPYHFFTQKQFRTLRRDTDEATMSFSREAARVPANPRVKKLAQLGGA